MRLLATVSGNILLTGVAGHGLARPEDESTVFVISEHDEPPSRLTNRKRIILAHLARLRLSLCGVRFSPFGKGGKKAMFACVLFPICLNAGFVHHTIYIIAGEESGKRRAGSAPK